MDGRRLKFIETAATTVARPGQGRKMRFNGRTNEPESGKEVYLRAFERKVDESVGRFDF